MANGARRSEVWYRDQDANDAWRLRLVINELDEFDSSIKSLSDEQAKMRNEIRARLNWLVGLVFSLLIGVTLAVIAMLGR